MDKDLLNAVCRTIIESEHLIALTGAGVSAESGIPTFRGKNGLWRKYRAEELATFSAFMNNPKLVWEWYSWRISMILRAKPNPAHISLAKLEKIGILKALITQNVDNLHERAGSEKIIKLHGDILTVKCISCDYKTRLQAPPSEIPPSCPQCGDLLRPGVVWFGEPLPREALEVAMLHASIADAIIVIGTSGVVYPAGAIPYIVKERNGKIIEINISRSTISPIADYFIEGKAGEILPIILSSVEKKCSSGGK